MPLSAPKPLATAALAAIATITSPAQDVSALSASRRTLSYMVAKRNWKASRSMANAPSEDDCPEPAKCQCHCDCPETKFVDAPGVPPPCPVYPVFPTVQPAPRKPKNGIKITAEIIQQLKGQVFVTQEKLETVQNEYKSLGECQSCDRRKVELRKKLVLTHQDYKRALDLLLGALAMWTPEEKKDEAAVKIKGPEFSKIADSVTKQNFEAMKGKPHCETWMSKSADVKLGEGDDALPYTPAEADCGQLCRNEATCVGFAQDKTNGFCVWWDNMKDDVKLMETEAAAVKDPVFLQRISNSIMGSNVGISVIAPNAIEASKIDHQFLTNSEFRKKSEVPSDDKCLQGVGDLYVKNREEEKSKDVFSKLEVLHGMQEALENALVLNEGRSTVAGDKFSNWAKKDLAEATDEDLDKFVASKTAYDDSLVDTKVIYFELLGSIKNALQQMRDEEGKVPVQFFVPEEEKQIVVKKEAPKVVAVVKPHPAKWEDFANSQDTNWSKNHPGCPQGPPCFCDCKCHGVPPQNFVDPPPPPPAPCPLPPPTPPPTALSLPMGAPPAMPLR